MSADVNARMKEAAKLIEAKRYAEARQILRTVDHPTARKWLAKIEDIERKIAASGASGRGSSSKPGATAKPAAKPAAPEPAARPSSAARAAAVDDLNMPARRSASQGPTIRRGGGVMLINVLVLLGIPVAAGIAGLLLHLSTGIAYIMVLSVLVFGLITGCFAWVVNYLARVHNLFLAIAVGALAGGIAYGVFWYAQYLEFVDNEYQVALQFNPDITRDQVSAVIDGELAAQFGSSGVTGFVQMRINEGMQLMRRRDVVNQEFGLGDTGRVTGPTETALYYGAELLISIVLAGGVASNIARRPYVIETGAWVKLRQIGEVPAEKINRFLDLIQDGYFADASRWMVPNGKGGRLPKLLVEMGRASEDAPDAALIIVQIYTDAQGNRQNKTLVNAVIPARAYNELLGR